MWINPVLWYISPVSPVIYNMKKNIMSAHMSETVVYKQYMEAAQTGLSWIVTYFILINTLALFRERER